MKQPFVHLWLTGSMQAKIYVLFRGKIALETPESPEAGKFTCNLQKFILHYKNIPEALTIIIILFT